jgi:hypothetical protein
VAATVAVEKGTAPVAAVARTEGEGKTVAWLAVVVAEAATMAARRNSRTDTAREAVPAAVDTGAAGTGPVDTAVVLALDGVVDRVSVGPLHVDTEVDKEPDKEPGKAADTGADKEVDTEADMVAAVAGSRT